MNIQQQITLNDQSSGLIPAGSSRYEANESSFTANTVTVLNVDETPSLGDIITPRIAFIRLISGDDLLVGLDGSDYPFRLAVTPAGTGECLSLRLDVEGLREITQIVCEADVAGSLDGTYFDLEDRSVTARVWINVDGASTPPSSPPGSRLIEVSIAEDDDANTVALAVQTAINADSEFTATVVDDTVTVIDVHTGTRSAGIDVDTGFTITTPQAGASSPTIHLKSVGTSQALVAFAPN